MGGAEWNERHFTKDRTWKGTDHAASLETAGLTKLCRDLNAVHTAMTYKTQDILSIEKPQRAKLKWGLYNAEEHRASILLLEHFYRSHLFGHGNRGKPGW